MCRLYQSATVTVHNLYTCIRGAIIRLPWEVSWISWIFGRNPEHVKTKPTCCKKYPVFKKQKDSSLSTSIFCAVYGGLYCFFFDMPVWPPPSKNTHLSHTLSKKTWICLPDGNLSMEENVLVFRRKKHQLKREGLQGGTVNKCSILSSSCWACFIRSSRRSSSCGLLMFLDQAFSTSPSPNCQNVPLGRCQRWGQPLPWAVDHEVKIRCENYNNTELSTKI